MSDDRSSTSAFTRADRRRLARARAAAVLARVYRRLDAVLLVAEGHGVTEAARRIRVARASVHRWIAAYLTTRDPAALADQPRRGRRRVAPTFTRDLLAATLALDPRAVGYRATTWTVPLLANYLTAQHGCRVAERTLRRRLHAWGYRWKRPRYVYSGRAEHLAQKKGLSSAA